MTTPVPAKAVIYCRVSDPKQVTRGSGLGSQETRCREYARAKGYEVVEVFRDEGASGGMIERPGMLTMLAFRGTSNPANHQSFRGFAGVLERQFKSGAGDSLGRTRLRSKNRVFSAVLAVKSARKGSFITIYPRLNV